MSREIVHDVWVEVDLTALQHNLKQVRGLLAPGVRLMAVVKGNGFGHGYIEPARAFLTAGADCLAVTRLDEALPLREAGIADPILVFAPIQPGNADAAIAASLECTVESLMTAKALSAAAQRRQTTARIHIKVDTGMGRLGLLPEEAGDFLKQIKTLPALEVVGLYTHFSSAGDQDLSRTRRQLERFNTVRKTLEAYGISYGVAHAANSAALLRLPEAHFGMVRPGTLLYGQYPFAHAPRSLTLQPTWKLKARVCAVRSLPAGADIGYGAEFTTRKPTRTAVLPIGYADGFTMTAEGPVYRQSPIKLLARKFTRALTVEIRGKSVPVLGRVSMQMTVLDVTDLPEVAIGDEATVPALRLATSPSLPRVYTGASSSE